jgi:hypothetical protein
VYFTDRGIEELGDRRSEDQVTLGWLAARLQAFAGLHPESGVPAGWLARAAARTTSCEPRVTWFAGGRVRPGALPAGGPAGRW